MRLGDRSELFLISQNMIVVEGDEPTSELRGWLEDLVRRGLATLDTAAQTTVKRTPVVLTDAGEALLQRLDNQAPSKLLEHPPRRRTP